MIFQQQRGPHHAGQGHRRTGAQVNSPADDDQGHSQSADGDNDRLNENDFEVWPGQKKGADFRVCRKNPDDEEQPDERPQRVPERAGFERFPTGRQFRYLSRGGYSSSLISGSSMFSGVTTWTPVSIRGSTFSPRKCLTMIITPR